MFFQKKLLENVAYIYFSFFIISFFTRIVFYEHSFICNDEVTFMVIGSDVLDGNLPYIRYFDLKGPLLYVIFALTDLIGDQIINSRIVANIFVFISSILFFKTLVNLNIGKTESYFGTIFFIFLFGISDFSQCLSSGVVCAPIISYITYLISKNEFKKKDCIYIGFSLALLSLVRQNLIIFSVLVTLLIIFRIQKKDILNKLILIILSGLVPFMLIFLLYSFYNNGIKIFIESYIFAALSFAENGKYNFAYFELWSNYFLKSGTLIIYLAMVVANFIFLFYEKNKNILNIVYLNFFLIFSIIMIAKPHAQYLVTAYFSLSIIFILAVYKFIKKPLIIINFLITYMFLLTIILGVQYKIINPDRWRSASQDLKAEINSEDVFFTSVPFYVLLDKKPLQKIFHPSFLNNGYPSIFKHIDNGDKNNLYYINQTINKKPTWIIIDKLEQYDFFSSVLERELNLNYNLFQNKDNFLIYKRN